MNATNTTNATASKFDGRYTFRVTVNFELSGITFTAGEEVKGVGMARHILVERDGKQIKVSRERLECLGR